MASSKSCRRYLVEQGAADLIVKLSRSSNRTATHDLCTLALGYLSEITRLNDGIVKKFLSLSMHPDETPTTTSNNNNNNNNSNSGRSTPLASRSSSARGHGHHDHATPGIHGIGMALETPEEAYFDDDDDDMGVTSSSAHGSGQNSARHGLGGLGIYVPLIHSIGLLTL